MISSAIAGLISLVLGIIILVAFLVLVSRVGKIADNVVRLRKYEQVKLIEAGLYDPSDGSFTKVVFNDDGTVSLRKPKSAVDTGDTWACSKCGASNHTKFNTCQKCGAGR
jgi:hypothetical protein